MSDTFLIAGAAGGFPPARARRARPRLSAPSSRATQTARSPLPFREAPHSSSRLRWPGLRMADPGLLLLWPPVEPPRTLAIHSHWLL
jgi:hypothetical protein